MATPTHVLRGDVLALLAALGDVPTYCAPSIDLVIALDGDLERFDRAVGILERAGHARRPDPTTVELTPKGIDTAGRINGALHRLTGPDPSGPRPGPDPSGPRPSDSGVRVPA